MSKNKVKFKHAFILFVFLVIAFCFGYWGSRQVHLINNDATLIGPGTTESSLSVSEFSYKSAVEFWRDISSWTYSDPYTERIVVAAYMKQVRKSYAYYFTSALCVIFGVAYFFNSTTKGTEVSEVENNEKPVQFYISGQEEQLINDCSEWKCPKCGEEIEGQFTDCWSCGRFRFEKY